VSRLLLALVAALAFGATVASAASLGVTATKLTQFTTCTLDSTSGGIDDAYAQQDAATTTHNTTVLDVKSDTAGRNQYTFIEFTNLLTSCPNLLGASTVTAATLTLVLTTAPTRAKTYTVSRVDPAGSFAQATLTWNNKPGVVSTTTTTFASGTTTGTRTADVTSDITLFAAGTANQGWRIADLGTTTTDTGVFASAESTTAANRPKLTISYVD
jgi:hypothetical protein